MALEFDAINTGDIAEFKAWLNSRLADGWSVTIIQVQNAPNLPIKPFTAIVQRDSAVQALPVNAFQHGGERGS